MVMCSQSGPSGLWVGPGGHGSLHPSAAAGREDGGRERGMERWRSTTAAVTNRTSQADMI